MLSTFKIVILSLTSIWTLVIESQCEFTQSIPPPAPLVLYSPRDPDYLEVLVARVGDNVTLVCQLQGEGLPQRFVWNYLADGEERHRLLQGELTNGPSRNSSLKLSNLQLKDSGQYICTAPPHSLTKYILVQNKTSGTLCPRGALQCGSGGCVLGAALCDGKRDCAGGEDEAFSLCHTNSPCNDPYKLNCSSGACISSAACCARRAPAAPPALCRQHKCCEEHPLYATSGYIEDIEYLYEDRHVADDYGYIQSTIYTVTACALIFMIACVLLVSAICKMHMKRTALRNHANTRYLQAHRLPPCYEASRLLERDGRPPSIHSSPSHLPSTPLRQNPLYPDGVEVECGSRSGLSRLGAMFSAYRQVPTHPPDVELQNVRHNTANNSPIRTQHLQSSDQSRSPTYSGDFYFTNEEAEDCSRDLNYVYRRRARPLTLQLGRFQLSIPNFLRNQDIDRRPDTPDITEINIEDLNFVRLNSNETYTLNGRTIRLLGANFENYPGVANRPPTYNEAVRVKYGPPPEYLSQDVLNTPSEVASNVEMPPTYDEIRSSDSDNCQSPIRNNYVLRRQFVNSNSSGGNFSGTDARVSASVSHTDGLIEDGAAGVSNIVVGGLDSNCNESVNVSRNDGLGNDHVDVDRSVEVVESPVVTENELEVNDESNTVKNLNTSVKMDESTDNYVSQSSTVTSDALAGTSFENRVEKSIICTNNNNTQYVSNSVVDEVSNGNDPIKNRFEDIIDNLPAIDSDVNANE